MVNVVLINIVMTALLGLWPTAAATTGPLPVAALPADEVAKRVGVNVHVMHGNTPYNDLQATQEALRYLGIRQIRDGIRWYGPGPAAWYDRELRQRLTTLGQAGVRLQLLLPGPDLKYGSVDDALRVAAGVPGVAAIEGVNEWDLKGPSDWADQARAQTQSVKAAMQQYPSLRQTRFVAPSFGRIRRAATVGNLSDAVDYGNAHPYANGGRPELAEDPGAHSIDDAQLDAATLSGPKPQIFTEFGYHNALRATSGQRAVDDRTAGVYLTRSILEFLRRGIARMYLYELVDSFNDPDRTSQEANWGLFSTTWQPKASARAVRALMTTLGDRGRSPHGAALGLELIGAGDNLRSLLLAKSDGRFTLALWRTDSVWNHATRTPVAVAPSDVAVRLQRPALLGATRMQRLGQPSRLRTLGSWKQLTVPVGAEPTFLTFRAATP